MSGRGRALIAATLLFGSLVPAVAAAASPTADAPHIHWPGHGEAAVAFGDARIHAGPQQRVVPIASVAKIMTAYVVMRLFPLTGDGDGFRVTVTHRDVRDTARRASEGQSLVPVSPGEQLSERQALAALLLPSANNVAIMLARRVAGSVHAFVQRMNRTAALLGMKHTEYTDPSGFLATTRSTARDQLRLALVAMRVPTFARMVRRSVFRIPVAGRIRNTDRLLGHDGFTGIKTGSDSAAGGCFAFRSWHRVRGHGLQVTGVVLGQSGTDLIGAGLTTGRRLVDDIVREART